MRVMLGVRKEVVAEVKSKLLSLGCKKVLIGGTSKDGWTEVEIKVYESHWPGVKDYISSLV